MVLGGAAAAAGAVVASVGPENTRHALAVGAYSLPIGDAFPGTVSMVDCFSLFVAVDRMNGVL